MSYLAVSRLVKDEDFRGRVHVAVFTTAQFIINEDGFDPESPRGRLALQATRLDEPVLDRFVWACATNPAISAAESAEKGSSVDNDLLFVVSSVWNAATGQPLA